MVPLARRNLLSEKGRFAMSVGGVAFAVLMVLIVVALYRGWSGVGSVYAKLPGDLWISQTGTSDPYHSTSFLPAGRALALARIEGVEMVLPVYARHIAVRHGGQEQDVFAMALAAGPAIHLPAQVRERYLRLRLERRNEDWRCNREYEAVGRSRQQRGREARPRDGERRCSALRGER